MFLNLFFTGKLDLKFKRESSEIGSITLCGAENWTLRKIHQKYRESFYMWWWRRLERIRWAD
jgi:hypothetical protein